MKNTLFKLIVVLLALPSIAITQATPTSTYLREDRGVILAEAERIQIHLARMAELAEWAASGLYTSTQLLALGNEFSALRSELDNIASSVHPLLSTQSSNFKAANFSTSALLLSNAAIDTNAGPAAQSNNRDLLDAVQLASVNFLSLTASNWQRLTLNGAVNNGNCAGGYSPQDAAVVKSKLKKGVGYLFASYRTVSEAAFGLLHPAQRSRVNSDFDFLKEEIELLGEPVHTGVTTQSDLFLRTILDPQYLGLDDEVINSNIFEDARLQAYQAISAIGAAYVTLVQCGA